MHWWRSTVDMYVCMTKHLVFWTVWMKQGVRHFINEWRELSLQPLCGTVHQLMMLSEEPTCTLRSGLRTHSKVISPVAPTTCLTCACKIVCTESIRPNQMWASSSRNSVRWAEPLFHMPRKNDAGAWSLVGLYCCSFLVVAVTKFLESTVALEKPNCTLGYSFQSYQKSSSALEEPSCTLA